MTGETKTTSAEWRPGWYELDQPLEVGRKAQFAFFRPRSDAVDEPLVFYNTLWKPADAVAAWGTVARITHPILGAISKVATAGLEYTFVLASGQRLVVDAEEEPGTLFAQTSAGWQRETPQIESWNLHVELADLTTLEPAPARLAGP